jgi:protein regulator of cytokinesis 1
VRLVTAEKNEMAEEAHRIITAIKQMETSLDDTKSLHEYSIEDESLKVTYPLIQCLQTLKEKHGQLHKLHKERFEQVKSECYFQERVTVVLNEDILLII